MTFLPQEIIARKRDKQELAADEIAGFIAGFADGSVSHAQAAAFAMAVYFNDMTRAERVALTLAMRDSGEVLDWADLPGPVIDKHSTGGVGDNVSLILAPVLAACGAYVPMISGRSLGHTGGTLDKFDSIPGYTTAPTSDQLRAVVKGAGCAIIGQTDTLAPADRTLYALRDVTATVESIPLITASILSKKLAAGLDTLILDVKTGSGAFMKTPETSRALAESLVAVANGAGLRTGALITDMNEPLASAAGNALEVRNAVDLLTGKDLDARLLDVTLALCVEALLLADITGDADDARERVKQALTGGAAAERFANMVSGLGGPADFIPRIDDYLPKAAIIRDVYPDETGHVSAIDTHAVGMAVVVLGGGRRLPTDDIDHAVGFDALAPLGAAVGPGIAIARIHANDEAAAAEAERRLRAAYQVGGEVPNNPLFAGRVGPEDIA